ncbi:Glycoside hydrolase 15-related [Nostocoides japonicum T1-X7]|uniref:Glycoside hydrolase 15-related n=1 Tax=Nostocoides japonicum T1-X7 TaxID=1194083 RepID=A0A077LTH3_9MICO|nr:glycoside hydrolase family 15 protein [Tetrasphaera japonica]CCH76511.1 Glycoside hydrolase 15-related [Tetrasphaera japonica T1-X7]
MTTPIEDYALIGDLGTAALVSREGSIDWLCLPRFDSPACFAALLGEPDHGRWLLTPVDDATTHRSYRDTSSILETVHTSETGSVKVTDLMPIGDGRSDILRIVEGLDGTVRMRHEWIVRFGYGRIRPWVTRGSGFGMHDDVLTAIAGPDMLVLRGTRLPRPDKSRSKTGVAGVHRDEFPVSKGQVYTFSLTWVPAYSGIPDDISTSDRIRETFDFARDFAEHSIYDGPYRDVVVRSLLTLRLLTDAVSGGIVAAPTTSLPEDPGGERNWDYRYCWLRDASLTLDALLSSGHVRSTKLWRDWLVRAIAGDPEDMQIMYRVDGGRDLSEYELDHLPGYAGSRPVRVGNAAVGQTQTDVLGEVMIALENARSKGLQESKQSWAVQKTLIDNLLTRWDAPDNGLWEIRGPKRHFTHSRVMVWAAFDRAVRGIEVHGYKGPLKKWRAARDRVRAEILEKGFDTERNTFTQHYDTTEVDASLLLIPIVGFLPPDDPRVVGTIAAVEEDLLHEGLLMRYRTGSGVDGLTGDEHPFLACSWWLVTAYAMSGRLDEADALMDRLVGLLNDVGLVSEEYDPIRQRMIGNFPQAFSHLALVDAAFALDSAHAAAEGREATTIEGSRAGTVGR